MTEQVAIGRIVIIKRTGADGTDFPLRQEKCVFGREQDCDIRIQLPTVSGHHTMLKNQGKKVYLSNLSDENPTLLNGEAITTETALKHNDTFTIGDRKFRFEYEIMPVATPKKTPIKTGAFTLMTPSRKPFGPSNSQSNVENKTPAAKASAMPSLPSLSSPAKKAGSSDQEQMKQPKGISENEAPVSSPKASSASFSPKSKGNNLQEVGASTPNRNVKFGPNLSPCVFDKDMPPTTPIRRGSMPSESQTTPKNKSLLKKATEASAQKQSSMDNMLMSNLSEFSNMSSVTEANTAANAIVTPRKMSPRLAAQREASPSPRPADSSSAAIVATSYQAPNEQVVSAATKEAEFARRKLATPIKSKIENGVSLQTLYKKSLSTPIRSEITTGFTKETHLKPLYKKMDTPLKSDIQQGTATLQKKDIGAVAHLATPVKKAIQEGATLQKKDIGAVAHLATPVRKAIQEGATLQKKDIGAVAHLATPVRKAIQEGATLQKKDIGAVAHLATPVKKAIQQGATLHKKDIGAVAHLATPVKNAIAQGVALQKKKFGAVAQLATPIKRDLVEGNVHLREAFPKKKLATPVRAEIVALASEDGGITSKLKSAMPKKKALQTPIRNQIVGGVALRKKQVASNKLSTPIRVAIQAMDVSMLNEVKKKMATPLRQEIVAVGASSLKPIPKIQPQKLHTPIREAINSKQFSLKKKAISQLQQTLPEKIRSEIEQANSSQLKPTGVKALPKALSTPVRETIKAANVSLRNTAPKPSLNTPVRAHIKEFDAKKELQPIHKKVLSTPLRAEIGSTIFQDLLKAKSLANAKRLPTPLKHEITSSSSTTVLKKKAIAEKVLASPIRRAISGGVSLRHVEVQKSATPFEEAVQAGTSSMQLAPPKEKEFIEASMIVEVPTAVQKAKRGRKAGASTSAAPAAASAVVAAEQPVIITTKPTSTGTRRSTKRHADSEEVVDAVAPAAVAPQKKSRSSATASKKKEAEPILSTKRRADAEEVIADTPASVAPQKKSRSTAASKKKEAELKLQPVIEAMDTAAATLQTPVSSVKSRRGAKAATVNAAKQMEVIAVSEPEPATIVEKVTATRRAAAAAKPTKRTAAEVAKEDKLEAKVEAPKAKVTKKATKSVKEQPLTSTTTTPAIKKSRVSKKFEEPTPIEAAPVSTKAVKSTARGTKKTAEAVPVVAVAAKATTTTTAAAKKSAPKKSAKVTTAVEEILPASRTTRSRK